MPKSLAVNHPITEDRLKNAPIIRQNDLWEEDKDQMALIENYYVFVD